MRFWKMQVGELRGIPILENFSRIFPMLPSQDAAQFLGGLNGFPLPGAGFDFSERLPDESDLGCFRPALNLLLEVEQATLNKNFREVRVGGPAQSRIGLADEQFRAAKSALFEI